MTEVVSFLGKLQTLMTSRRVWLLVVAAAAGLLVISGDVVNILGVDINIPQIEDPETETDVVMAVTAKIGELLGALAVIVSFFGVVKSTIADFTARPPGSFDVSGTAGVMLAQQHLWEMGASNVVGPPDYMSALPLCRNPEKAVAALSAGFQNGVISLEYIGSYLADKTKITASEQEDILASLERG